MRWRCKPLFDPDSRWRFPASPVVLVLAASTAMIVAAHRDPAFALGLGCAAFSNRIWAQTVIDTDPNAHTNLDPDRDGLACEALPLGAAPT